MGEHENFRETVGVLAVSSVILACVAPIVVLILFSPFSLLLCSTSGGPQDIRAAVRRGCDVNARGRVGPALALAAAEDLTGNVRTLLDEGADVDGRTSRGRTALMLAAIHDRPAAAAVLLDAGAHAELVDNTGKTALDLARPGGDRPLVELLQGAAVHESPSVVGFRPGTTVGSATSGEGCASSHTRAGVIVLLCSFMAVLVVFGELGAVVRCLPISTRLRTIVTVLVLGGALAMTVRFSTSWLGFQAPWSAVMVWIGCAVFIATVTAFKSKVAQ